MAMFRVSVSVQLLVRFCLFNMHIDQSKMLELVSEVSLLLE